MDDGAFAEDASNEYMNIGTGMFYYTNKYNLAFSVPDMLKGTHLDFNGVEYGNDVAH